MQRKAIVIGATGLVGQHLVKQLSELNDTLI
ncbi:oxidoreductase, partial [Klebsiella pneumoniae]